MFLDGTETSSSALSYVLYELAANPDCQDKLYNEIAETFVIYKEETEAIEAVQKSAYLEGIIYESMRIYPPANALAKVCMNEYQLPKNNLQTKSLTIYPGTAVYLPVEAIHM